MRVLQLMCQLDLWNVIIEKAILGNPHVKCEQVLHMRWDMHPADDHDGTSS